MSNLPACGVPTFEGFFFEFAALIPIIMFVQLLLFFHSIYQELTQQFAVNLLRRVLYMLMQIVAMYWTFFDFLRFALATEYTSLLSDEISCGIAAISPKIIPNVFYGMYLFQILLRLKDSFDATHLQVSRTRFVIASMIIISYNALNPIAFLFVLNRSPCLHAWNPPDRGSTTLSFCGLPLLGGHDATGYMVIFAVVFVELANVSLAAVSFIKSYKLLRDNAFSNKEEDHFEIISNMIKVCLLTATGALTSTFAYAIWMLQPPISAVFLYLDLVVNCVVIGLLFKHNEKYYKILCKCCIWCMFTNLNKPDDPQEIECRVHAVSVYLNGEPDHFVTPAMKTKSPSSRHQRLDSMSLTNVEMQNIQQQIMNGGGADLDSSSDDENTQSTAAKMCSINPPQSNNHIHPHHKPQNSIINVIAMGSEHDPDSDDNDSDETGFTELEHVFDQVMLSNDHAGGLLSPRLIQQASHRSQHSGKGHRKNLSMASAISISVLSTFSEDEKKQEQSQHVHVPLKNRQRVVAGSQYKNVVVNKMIENDEEVIGDPEDVFTPRGHEVDERKQMPPMPPIQEEMRNPPQISPKDIFINLRAARELEEKQRPPAAEQERKEDEYMDGNDSYTKRTMSGEADRLKNAVIDSILENDEEVMASPSVLGLDEETRRATKVNMSPLTKGMYSPPTSVHATAKGSMDTMDSLYVGVSSQRAADELD